MWHVSTIWGKICEHKFGESDHPGLLGQASPPPPKLTPSYNLTRPGSIHGGGASKITPNHVKTHRITGNHAKTHTQMWSDDIFIFFFIFFIFKFSSLIKDAETFWFSPLFLFLFDLSYGSRTPVVTSEERFFFLAGLSKVLLTIALTFPH